MKMCKKCSLIQELSNFPLRKDKKDGYHIYCKKCVKQNYIAYQNENKAVLKEKRHEYYLKNREIILKKQKESRVPGSRSIYLKKYYQVNKHKMDENTKKYRKNNKEKFNEWARVYYSDPTKRIARNMYNRIRIALKQQLLKKHTNTQNLCGCTWEDLKNHLESKFKNNMSWDNYGAGYGKWSIDHIIPCSKFNLTNENERKKCFHYTNLQPLWTSENSSKRNKYNYGCKGHN